VLIAASVNFRDGPAMDRSCTCLWLTCAVDQDRVGDSPGKWLCLGTTTLFSSKWLELRRDEAVRPDGSAGEYDHVVVPSAVTVVAVNEQGQVLVTRQWIYTHHGTQWRLPSGRIDASDADPEAAASRELAEETGFSAAVWTKLGVIHGADSFSNHRDFAFLARDLTAGEPRLAPGEADLRTHWLPFHQVLTMVIDGQIPHAGSSFAILMANTLGLVAAPAE
jgi:ADP-ribose pyrophosphatase